MCPFFAHVYCRQQIMKLTSLVFALCAISSVTAGPLSLPTQLVESVCESGIIDCGEVAHVTPLLQQKRVEEARLKSEVHGIGNITSYAGYFTVNGEILHAQRKELNFVWCRDHKLQHVLLVFPSSKQGS